MIFIFILDAFTFEKTKNHINIIYRIGIYTEG